MEMFRTSAYVSLSEVIVLLIAFAWGLHALYRCEVRRYQRAFDSTYTRRFEQRAKLARALHPDLARSIQSSKYVVDRVRAKLPDGPEAEAVFNRVSELLERAAGEGDRALKSLERSGSTWLHKG